MLSQYVEQLYARELLADGAGAVGYLLKDRVFDIRQFLARCARWPREAPRWIPRWSRTDRAHSRDEPMALLTPREREVLSLMAEGRSNAAIAARLFITEKAVSKHTDGHLQQARRGRRPKTTTGASSPSSPIWTPDGRRPYGRTAPSKVDAYQPVFMGSFWTFMPVCGASMM